MMVFETIGRSSSSTGFDLVPKVRVKAEYNEGDGAVAIALLMLEA